MILKTLANTTDCKKIRRRIAALAPEARRVWGTMCICGMLCHLNDSYLSVLGERPLSASSLGIPQPVAKFMALRSPFHWPRNLMTAESVRQGGGGTPPSQFDLDRARLLETYARFCDCTQLIAVHPMFGGMARADWLRWGYLHADHHLRQFSA
jgi:hypothetical protein